MSSLKRESIQTNNQPKKLTIKNLKAVPKLPSNFEEITWQKLQEAIRAIQNNVNTSLSLEELYKAAEDMCVHKMAPNLYNNMKIECELHVQKQARKLLNQTSQTFEYLSLVNACWHEHCKQMIDIRSVLLYLDRTYVLQNASILSIWDLGLSLFREYVMSQEEIKRKVVYSFLSLVQKEREGDAIDRSLMKSISRMFSSLQIYNDLLEKPFLDASEKFYQSEGNIKSRELESADYLKHIDNRIIEESERVLYYLESTTKRSLISIVEKYLIQNHLEFILSGFTTLAKNLRKEDIKRMYSLISRISQLDKLKETWKTYIKETGLEMIKAENNLVASSENIPNKEKSLVQDLLDFKQQLDQLLEEAFNKSDPFVYALKEAFENFINSRANKPAELIAKYVDSKLKGGKKGLSEEELEIVLDKVLVLFRFIHGKDIFEAFYKKDLAKRLLLQKSSSFDAEKLMISKLKAECGASFTNKLEGMFKDIDISKDVMSSFKQSPFYSQLAGGGLDLYVHVLTAGYWPAYPQIEVTLPKQMNDYQEIFKKFYLSKHSGRRLTFQNSLGYCTLRANFKAGKKELIVSVYQTVVLLAFNASDNLSFTDIKSTTNLDDKELKRVLYSLTSGKVKLLIKQTKTKDINEEDIFTYNKDFKFKLYRIKVNTIQMKETVEENQKTTQNVMQDRQYQIDAAIVRIMKTRKSLSHTKLVNEVLAQLKFDIRVVFKYQNSATNLNNKGSDIKKRIESLIDREYLERDSSDAQTYLYVA